MNDLKNIPLEPIYSLKRFFVKKKEEKSPIEIGSDSNFIEALNLQTKTGSLKFYVTQDEEFWQSSIRNWFETPKRNDDKIVRQLGNISPEEIEYLNQIEVISV